MNKMRAAFIEQYGSNQNIQLGELPIPKPRPNQVLIRVKAAGVNPVDYQIRNGMLADQTEQSLPLILGWDVAGIIEQTGEQVRDFDIGDEVFAFASIWQQGGYAEYITVDAKWVVNKPNNLNFIDSAAVPLAATTAWQGLFQDGQLAAGQKVLILGASGGVGGFAVQMAKAAGAYVIATASERTEMYVSQLGADEIIRYREVDFQQVVDEVDLVFVLSSGDQVVEKALSVTKPGGYVVSALDDVSKDIIKQSGVNFKRMWVQPNGSDLTQIKQWIEHGKLSVKLDSVYSLAQANQAIKRSESRRAVGKIILDIDA